MKIAYLVNHLACVGGIRRIVSLTNELVDLGEDVTIFIETELRYDWPVIKARILPWEDRLTGKFDVVCVSQEDQYLFPKDVDAKAIVYYILGYGAGYKIPDICRASYEQGYYMIANSNWTADRIADECGTRPFVVHGAIDTSLFHPVEVEKKYDLLCYGDKRPVKQIHRLQWVAARAGLNMYQYYGKKLPQSAMAEEYSKARIFLSGSLMEGWNWPCLEAMACGVPVIKTRDGGSADYCVDGENCIECEIEHMPDKIKLLRGDEELQHKLIHNGFETVKRFSDWRPFAELFIYHCKIASS